MHAVPVARLPLSSHPDRALNIRLLTAMRFGTELVTDAILCRPMILLSSMVSLHSFADGAYFPGMRRRPPSVNISAAVPYKSA